MLIRHNEDDLDKVFRQKLYGVEEESPLHLWEGIRQRVPQRKRVIWRWLLPLLLLVSGTTVWAGYMYIQSLPSSAQVVASASIASPKQPLVQHAAVLPYVDDMDEKTTNVGDAAIASNNFSDASINRDEDKQPADNTIRKQTLNKHDAQQKGNRQTASSTTLTTPTDHNTLSPPSYAEANTRADHAQLQPTELSTELPSSNVYSTTMTSLVNAEYLIDSLWSRPQNVFSLEQPIIREDTLIKTIEKDVFSPLLPYIDSPALRPNRLSVGVYYSLSQPMRMKRSSADDASFRDLTNRTNLDLAHGVGAQASYRMGGNWEMSAGLEYQRFNERHRWSDTTIVYGKIYSLVLDSTYEGTELTVTPVVHDSTVYQKMSSKNYEVTNRYTSVQMPLIVRWNYFKGNYSLGLEAGAVLRLMSTYKGVIAHMDWLPVPPFPINSATGVPVTEYAYQSKSAVPLQQVYKDWTTELHLGIQQSYRFADRWSASLALQTRIMLNEDDAPRQTNHRIIQPGVRVGLNYFIR